MPPHLQDLLKLHRAATLPEHCIFFALFCIVFCFVLFFFFAVAWLVTCCWAEVEFPGMLHIVIRTISSSVKS